MRDAAGLAPCGLWLVLVSAGRAVHPNVSRRRFSRQSSIISVPSGASIGITIPISGHLRARPGQRRRQSHSTTDPWARSAQQRVSTCAVRVCDACERACVRAVVHVCVRACVRLNHTDEDTEKPPLRSSAAQLVPAWAAQCRPSGCDCPLPRPNIPLGAIWQNEERQAAAATSAPPPMHHHQCTIHHHHPPPRTERGESQEALLAWGGVGWACAGAWLQWLHWERGSMGAMVSLRGRNVTLWMSSERGCREVRRPKEA